MVIDILPNISRSKDNQTIQFNQLIDYNTKIILIKKEYKRYCGDTSPRPFSEK